MKTYIRDDDGDIGYKLLLISNNDNQNNKNEGTMNGVGQQETNAVAADNSPISETGRWETVNRGGEN